MKSQPYDIVIIGGGLGGSALARSMAEHGASVILFERENQFRDRVRGEYIEPWGVAEAKRLGLYDTLRSVGHPLRWWNSGSNVSRDMPATTQIKEGGLTFFHPQMQQAVIEAASNAGVVVVRGATVRAINRNRLPEVIAIVDGKEVTVQAKLVVVADGRGSAAREWAGFTVRKDPEVTRIAGVLLEQMDLPLDAAHTFRDARNGRYVLLFPQRNGYVRAYLASLPTSGAHLSGEKDVQRFVEQSISAGATPAHFCRAKPVGPLATFSGADIWVDHPYRDGVALIGDAAASSDPTWGQGLSLTLRDARVLRDALIDRSNWDEAGHAFATEHDRYYSALHTFESWVTQMFMQVGPAAEAMREKALPLWKSDPSRVPDIKSGPDFSLDETARRRFFGED
jgi:menaquinone-9 beta-reductase